MVRIFIKQGEGVEYRDQKLEGEEIGEGGRELKEKEIKLWTI